MGKAFNILLSRVVPLLLITVAAGFAVLHTQGDQLLSVQTGSMEPTISKGDLLAVKSIPVHQLQVGDVITFNSNQDTYAGSTITHRIVELPNEANKQQFITKGDANPANDKPVPQNLVVGRVDKDVPYLGYLLTLLATPIGLLAIIYIPALFIIIDEIKRLTQHFNKQKPWRDLNHSRFRSNTLSIIGLAIIVSTTTGSAGTLANIKNSVTITQNTISAVQRSQGSCVSHRSSLNRSAGRRGSDGNSSNTNINIQTTTNQQSTSGNAGNTNNTNSGNATSGNASNCNSTNINITVQN